MARTANGFNYEGNEETVLNVDFSHESRLVNIEVCQRQERKEMLIRMQMFAEWFNALEVHKLHKAKVEAERNRFIAFADIINDIRSVLVFRVTLIR